MQGNKFADQKSKRPNNCFILIDGYVFTTGRYYRAGREKLEKFLRVLVHRVPVSNKPVLRHKDTLCLSIRATQGI